MTLAGYDIKQLQQKLLALIIDSEGPQSTQVQNYGQLDAKSVAKESGEIFDGTSELPAGERLAIYRRAYFLRLINCMREKYPVLRHAIGDELFDLFASDYLRHYPSTSYSLTGLDRFFPHHLAESRPERTLPSGVREQWPELIIDLARLEHTFGIVYNGPGIEGQASLDARRLMSLAPEKWRELRLMPVPCLKLMTFQYPVAQYFLAVRKKETAELPAPRETYTALTRSNYVVCLHDLSGSQFRLLEAIVAGERLGAAIERVGSAPAGAHSDSAETVRGWLHNCAVNGFFLESLRFDPSHLLPRTGDSNQT